MILLIFFLFLLIYFSLVKGNVYGLGFYFFIRLVIPQCARLGISFNSICLLIVLVKLFPKLRRNYLSSNAYTKSYIRLLLFLVSTLLILGLFASFVPFSWQFASLSQFAFTEILPSILLLLYIKNKNDYKIIFKFLVLGSIFNSLYALYTYFVSSNFLFEIYNTANTITALNVLDPEKSGRLGLINSARGIYDDPIFQSLISLLIFSFMFGKKILSNKYKIFLLSTSAIACILTTKRSAIMGLGTFVILLLTNSDNRRKIKAYLKYIILTLPIIIYFSAKKLAAFQNLLLSTLFIFDDSKQAELGLTNSSNVDMRFNQLSNIFKAISNSFLQGLGYDFPNYLYHISGGMDSRFLGFESFIFSTGASSGLIGLFMWLFVFYKLIKINNLCKFKNSPEYKSLIISYFIAILATNTSGSLYLFFTFFVLNILYIRLFIKPQS